MRSPVVFLWLAAMALAGFSACGGSTTGDAFPDPDVVGRSTNPEGVPYPTANLGGTPRRGAIPGSIIPNFTFQGYVGGVTSGGLTTISLADFYDPTKAHHKVLNIIASASWCSACVAAQDELAPLVAELEKEGGVFLTALVEGPSPGTGPSLGDLDVWVQKHALGFTTVIDSEARRLASVEEAGVPWNALIDTRTMEILQSSSGAPDDVAAYIRLGVTFVDTH